MQLDLSKLNKEAIASIENVESRGHVRYIRYMLSKRMSVSSLRRELARLALSAPSAEDLRVYFQYTIYPLAKLYGLSKHYAAFMKKLEPDKEGLISFSTSLSDTKSERVNFCLFLKDIEVDSIWLREISKHYGGLENIPVDSEGNKVIEGREFRFSEKVLTCPKRYLVDKYLAEGVSSQRISNYLKTKFRIDLSPTDIAQYSKVFFNFQRGKLEDVIDALNNEREELLEIINVLDEDEGLSIGELSVMYKNYEDRLVFLEESLKSLNAKYSDLTFTSNLSDRIELQDMLEDVVNRTYDRFKQLDETADINHIKPLNDVTKILYTGVDKIMAIKKHTIAVEKATADKDKTAGEILVQLIQETYDEHKNTQKEEAGIRPDEDIVIEGIEDSV